MHTWQTALWDLQSKTPENCLVLQLFPEEELTAASQIFLFPVTVLHGCTDLRNIQNNQDLQYQATGDM